MPKNRQNSPGLLSKYFTSINYKEGLKRPIPLKPILILSSKKAHNILSSK